MVWPPWEQLSCSNARDPLRRHAVDGSYRSNSNRNQPRNLVRSLRRRQPGAFLPNRPHPMKRFVTMLFLSVAAISLRGQVAPLLQSKLGTNGALTVTWPVHRIVNLSTNLHACYQIEVANTLGEWIPQGPLLRGEKFPNRIGSALLENALNTPALFYRVRAVFDFSGGQFVERSI